MQGITDELRAFGAVVGPKFMHCATQEVNGIEINQLDLKDAVVSELFCKNRFSSRAPVFVKGHRVSESTQGLQLTTPRGGTSTSQTGRQRRSS